MVTIQAKLLSKILRLANLKQSLDKTLDGGSTATSTSAEPPKSMLQKFNIEKARSNGRSVYTLSTKTEPGIRHIFYLHGGAYVLGFNRLHWSFIARLIQATGCTIVAPDYPLAPENTYLDSFSMVEPIYKELVARVGVHNVVLMGDSAGGGFALALAQKLKADGLDFVSPIILLSPWLDIALENQDIPNIAVHDPILDVSALKRAGKCYAGSSPLSNCLLSPINGDLHGLEKISVFIGTHDIMLADARKLKRTAANKGIAMNFFEYDGMLHVWMLFNLPESKRVIDAIAVLLGPKTT